MKLLKALTAGIIVTASLSTVMAGLAPARPNLKITQITRSNTTARVTIRNDGSADAGACVLAGFAFNGNGLEPMATTKFAALAAGATRIVTVNNALVNSAVIGFNIDDADVIDETKESDNEMYYPYAPAG